MEFTNSDWFYTLMSNLTKMIRYESFHVHKQNSYILFMASSVFHCFIAAELLSDLEGAFQEKIDVAYFDTSKYLLDVLNRNYLLLEHLQAMRRYLLLGQGDFIRHLMDLLKLAAHNNTLLQLKKLGLILWLTYYFIPRPELVRPATTLYQHNLTGILETAVRATNAQFDNAEILKRLDVRLLEVMLFV